MSSWLPEEIIVDMEPALLNYCKDFIAKAFNEEKTDKAIADYIRSKLVEKEEGKWNVIIGRNFGSHVVHSSRRYGYFHVGEMDILIWAA
jgi:dynein light chain LC8-type